MNRGLGNKSLLITKKSVVCSIQLGRRTARCERLRDSDDDIDSTFGVSFIFRRAFACRDDGGVIVFGHLIIVLPLLCQTFGYMTEFAATGARSVHDYCG